ncbi:MAG: ThiF family adenylyltransferase [Candidatus Solibacter sp.]|nr:ThiF family adenylyltransferase [Candidatus Solibacter sp.]
MSGKTIVVAGAGVIGSHFVPHLARLEDVGRVVLIDRDIYEPRNLANQDILPGDVGKPKVLVQARRLAKIRPNLEVAAIHAPLESVPLGTWRADLIVACLDSRAARQAVNERAWRVGVPWVYSGVLAPEWLARVNVYAPAAGAPCLECAWSAEDYRLLEQQYPCDGPARMPTPTGAPSALGALAAALMALECRKMLGGEVEHAAVGRQVTLNARWHQFSVTLFRPNRQCRFDHATWAIEPLACDAHDLRLADLLPESSTVRVPGQRFVRRRLCRQCGRESRVFHLECSLDPGLRQCDACGKPMATPGFDVVETLSRDLPPDVLGMSLADAGLRYGDVVQCGDRFLEIAAKGVIADDK